MITASVTQQEASNYLQGLKAQLFRPTNWQKIFLLRDWCLKFPDISGVYILIESNNVVYVGETGSIQGRMLDLRETRNHTVRRSIGKKYFYSEKEFIMSTTKVKFPEHIEKMVDNHI